MLTISNMWTHCRLWICSRIRRQLPWPNWKLSRRSRLPRSSRRTPALLRIREREKMLVVFILNLKKIKLKRVEEDDSVMEGDEDHRWTKRTQGVVNSIATKLKINNEVCFSSTRKKRKKIIFRLFSTIYWTKHQLVRMLLKNSILCWYWRSGKPSMSARKSRTAIFISQPDHKLPKPLIRNNYSIRYNCK